MAVSTDLRELVNSKRSEIIAAGAAAGASNFSVLFPEPHDDTDPEIEFIADFQPGLSLLDRINLINALDDLLGRRTHVFVRQAIPLYFMSLEHESTPL
ncbi:MAG: DNA polymerase subunit beta [Dehalococcoidia bacterium]